MLDTVSLKFNQGLTKTQLSDWNIAIYSNSPGRLTEKYSSVIQSDSNATIRVTYFSPNLSYPEPFLKFEFSIPKIYYGNNVPMIDNTNELEKAILNANELISEYNWIPKVNLFEGILGRVDLYYNHSVGERVSDYIEALAKLNYPKRKPICYPNRQVTYKSKIISTKFYDKFRECRLPSALGILRQETTIRKTYYIERYMKLKNPTIHDITKERVRNILQADLDRLRIKDNLFTNRDLSLEILLKKYSPAKAIRLYGYLIANQFMSIEELKSFNMNYQCIKRNERLINDANIALSLINSRYPLPTLGINL